MEYMMPNWKIKRQTLPNYQFHLGQSRSRDKSMEIMEEGGGDIRRDFNMSEN